MISDNLYTLPTDDLVDIADRAKDDLAALRGGCLFLTGGTSFFGKWLIEALLYANEHLGLNLKLTVLSRVPDYFLASMPHFRLQAALTILKGDIQTFDPKGFSFTHAIHGANLLFDGAMDWPVRHMETAVRGIKHLVNVSVESGCRNLLYLSSGAAYRAEASSGLTVSPVLREAQADSADNLSEPSVYSITKRFTEVYATGLGEICGIRIPLARCFTFAGPYMPLYGHQALGNFMADALAGRDIVVKGDGTPIRSYMYGTDLVVWLLALLVRGRHGVPYNVGSKQAVSIKETAESVSRAFPDKKIGVRIMGKIFPGNAPSLYLPDISRGELELGLTCSATLENICAKTARWIAQQAG